MTRITVTDTIRRALKAAEPEPEKTGHRVDWDAVNRDLPSADDIRSLLAGKQYFDNDYSPTDFLSCQCKRLDCPRCRPQDNAASGSCID